MLFFFLILLVVVPVWAAYRIIRHFLDKIVDLKPKTVLITGCANGIARAIVEKLIAHGDRHV